MEKGETKERQKSLSQTEMRSFLLIRNLKAEEESRLSNQKEIKSLISHANRVKGEFSLKY